MAPANFRPPEEVLDEFLNILEMELGVKLSEQERQLLKDYAKQSPSLTPETILQKVLAVAKKKLEHKLTEKNIKDARKRIEHTRLAQICLERSKLEAWAKKKPKVPAQKIDKRITDKESEHIIKEAEKKLVDNKKLSRKLTERERQKALQQFKNNIKVGDSPIDKANQALLGVLNVGIAGAVRVVVLHNWGNMLNVPDRNPYHGMSALDQSGKIYEAFGDSLGIEARAVINCIQTGALSNDFFNKLNKHLQTGAESQATKQMNVEEQKKTEAAQKAPTPAPPGAKKPWEVG